MPIPYQLIFAAVLASCLAGTVSAQDVKQTPIPDNHPLVGTWRIELNDGKCFEEYEVRPDGSKLSRSADERNESVFEISLMASPKGFYRWADKLTKTNGKPDCGGSTSKLGHVAINYIRMHSSHDRFLLCEAEDMQSCFTEFTRRR